MGVRRATSPLKSGYTETHRDITQRLTENFNGQGFF
jgi:hypothetical protein